MRYQAHHRRFTTEKCFALTRLGMLPNCTRERNHSLAACGFSAASPLAPAPLRPTPRSRAPGAEAPRLDGPTLGKHTFGSAFEHLQHVFLGGRPLLRDEADAEGEWCASYLPRSSRCPQSPCVPGAGAQQR